VFRPAIESVWVDGTPLHAVRVDESKSGDSIISEIIRGIAQSILVLADVSVVSGAGQGKKAFRNGNVMYELGLAHAVKSPEKVLVVRDDCDDFLLDVTMIPHRTIDFSTPDSAKREVAELVADRIRGHDRIADIKLRNFIAALTPHEYALLERLAACPEGHTVQLSVEVDGRRILPIPTHEGLCGLRAAGLARATFVEECPDPCYSLTRRGRQVPFGTTFKDAPRAGESCLRSIPSAAMSGSGGSPAKCWYRKPHGHRNLLQCAYLDSLGLIPIAHQVLDVQLVDEEHEYKIANTPRKEGRDKHF